MDSEASRVAVTEGVSDHDVAGAATRIADDLDAERQRRAESRARSLANLRPAWAPATRPNNSNVFRNKIQRLRRECRDYAPTAIKTLVACMNDENGRVRVAAATALLDRAGVTGNPIDASAVTAGSLVDILRELGRMGLRADPASQARTVDGAVIPDQDTPRDS